MRELALPGVDGSASLHGRGGTVVVLGHGAGGNRRTPMLVALAAALAASGRAALLYNFPYAERGSRRPDPPALLEAATRAAARLALEEAGAERVVHGGRSMGGRIASQVVAAGEPAAGLAFLGCCWARSGSSRRARSSRGSSTPTTRSGCSRDRGARRTTCWKR
jgi:predicted alpha/beta-hydrolase family hydrolase